MKKAIEEYKEKIQELQKTQDSLYNDLINEINGKLNLTEKQKDVIFDYVFNDFEGPSMKEFLK